MIKIAFLRPSCWMEKLFSLSYQRWFFLSVMSTAFIFHITMVFLVKNHGLVISPIQDPLEYRMLAENLLSHHVFSTSPEAPYAHELLRTPFYPLVVAALLAIGHNALLIPIIQVILHFLIGLSIILFLRSRVQPVLAILAGAGWLFEPSTLLLSFVTMSEIVFAATLLTIVISLLAQKQGRFYIGVVMGAAILTRANGILCLLGPILAEISLFKAKAFKPITLFLVGIILVIGPWIYRNEKLVHKFLLSSSGAYNLVLGFGDEPMRQTLRDREKESPILKDGKGRTGYALWTYTAEGYSLLKTSQAQTLQQVGYGSFFRQNLMCITAMWASGVEALPQEWFRSFQSMQYILTLLSKLIMSFLWIFASIAAFCVFYSKNRPLILLALGILIPVSIANLCMSYWRMATPFYPILLIIAAVGADELFSLLKKSDIFNDTIGYFYKGNK